MSSSPYGPRRAYRGSVPWGGAAPNPTTDTPMQGWPLPAPGDDVKQILLKHRAGEQLTDEEYQRLSQRVGAENETARMGGRVEKPIQPRRLTPYELGQRDRENVSQDQRDLAEYSAGRGFPVKPAGPTAAQLAARQNGINRPSSGGVIYRGSGDAQKTYVYAGQPSTTTDPNRAGSGGTIARGGVVRTYAGTPAKTPSASAVASTRAATVPLAGDEETTETAPDSEGDEGDVAVTNPKKKPRRDILAA